MAPDEPPTGRRRALLVATATYSDPALAALRAPTGDVAALADRARRRGDRRLRGPAADRPARPRSCGGRSRRSSARAARRTCCCSTCPATACCRRAAASTSRPPTRRSGLLRSTAIEDSFVNDVMQSSRARSIVLVLDCCHSGAFGKGLAPKSATTVDVEHRFEGRGGMTLIGVDRARVRVRGDRPERHQRARPGRARLAVHPQPGRGVAERRRGHRRGRPHLRRRPLRLRLPPRPRALGAPDPRHGRRCPRPDRDRAQPPRARAAAGAGSGGREQHGRHPRRRGERARRRCSRRRRRGHRRARARSSASPRTTAAASPPPRSAALGRRPAPPDARHRRLRPPAAGRRRRPPRPRRADRRGRGSSRSSPSRWRSCCSAAGGGADPPVRSEAAPYDFSGNRPQDVFGRTNERQGTGASVIWSRRHRRHAGRSVSAAAGGVPEPAERRRSFGTAVASGDFNGDGKADLAVGVPASVDLDGVDGDGAGDSWTRQSCVKRPGVVAPVRHCARSRATSTTTTTAISWSAPRERSARTTGSIEILFGGAMG